MTLSRRSCQVRISVCYCCSFQVLSKALEVWGLSATPITSPDMRGVAEEPQREVAFICNLEVGTASIFKFGPGVDLFLMPGGCLSG